MDQDKKTLLLIDDSEGQLKVLQILLSSIGFNVITASNAEDGLRTVQHDRDSVDLVLCDIQMPGMDGIAFVQKLKDNQDTTDIPIILLSAAGDHYELEGGTYGADAICTKDNVKQNLFPLLKRFF